MEGSRDLITQRTSDWQCLHEIQICYPPCIDLYLYLIQYSVTFPGSPTLQLINLLEFTFFHFVLNI